MNTEPIDATASPLGGADPSAGSGHRGVDVRMRLLIAIGLVMTLVAIPAVYALLRLTVIENIAADLRARYAATSVVLGTLEASLADFDRAIRGYVATADPSLGRQANDAYEASVQTANRLSQAGFGESMRGVENALDTLGVGLAAIDVAVAEDRLEDATAALDLLKPVMARDVRLLAPVRAAIDQRATSTVEQAESTSRATASFLLVSLLITLGLAAIVAIWITRQVSNPLGRLEAATGTLAAGNFQLPENLPYRRQDEIGGLTRAFARMAERLSELERLRADFMAAVTHDLKNPINVIAGYAQMLETGVYGAVTGRQEDTARRIREQAQVLEEQVNHLTDLSRMEAGGFRVEPAPLRTGELLAKAERSFRALADQRNIRFRVEGYDVPDRIVADADRLLHEVLGNLLGNAFKFTEPGGEVTLRVGRAQLNGSLPRRDAIRLIIRDSGQGIPRDALPHVFDRYYQADADGRRKGGGLGLAIARQVVEGHGGVIRVDSRMGEGATFTVDLPVAGPAAGPESIAPGPADDGTPT